MALSDILTVILLSIPLLLYWPPSPHPVKVFPHFYSVPPSNHPFDSLVALPPPESFFLPPGFCSYSMLYTHIWRSKARNHRWKRIWGPVAIPDPDSGRKCLLFLLSASLVSGLLLSPGTACWGFSSSPPSFPPFPGNLAVDLSSLPSLCVSHPYLETLSTCLPRQPHLAQVGESHDPSCSSFGSLCSNTQSNNTLLTGALLLNSHSLETPTLGVDPGSAPFYLCLCRQFIALLQLAGSCIPTTPQLPADSTSRCEQDPFCSFLKPQPSFLLVHLTSSLLPTKPNWTTLGTHSQHTFLRSREGDRKQGIHPTKTRSNINT